jgi:hypothetical protein
MKYYVYGHYTNDNKLFYIGVGTILNFKSKKHSSIYSRAYHFSNRTRFWNNIRNKYGVNVKILSHFNTKEESLKEERKLIEKFGRKCMNEGMLCNLSIGGKIGPVGRIFKMSEKQKIRLSEIKSTELYIYNSEGIYLISIKKIKNAAKYCGVTYNAIHSCLQTKNYSNGYFIFKEFKGTELGYTVDDLNFKSTLCKTIISEDLKGNILEHKSITDCSKFLNCSRESVRDALKRKGTCKKHKIYLKGESAAKPLSNLLYGEGSETMEKSSTPMPQVETANTINEIVKI